MKLLVTGGAGFIGSNFINYWFERHPGDEIVNIDKLTYAANKKNVEKRESKSYRFVEGDIADTRAVDGLVKDVDAVVNFAAESHVDNSIIDSSPFIHSNILGVQVLLEAARKYEKRLHQVSTDEVYGSLASESKGRFTESSPYVPRNPYAATKAAADHLVRAYCNTYNLKVSISNCSNNMGPYQHVEKLIPKCINNAMNNVSIPVYGDGLQVRDWLYVEDHCSAIESILMHDTVGETYLVSANQEKRNIEVVREILRRLGRPESLISYVKDRPGHDVRYALDASKIRNELGWSPRYDFGKALDKTMEWYGQRPH
jgi:dTDP-glucose 4,6-dehydratase